MSPAYTVALLALTSLGITSLAVHLVYKWIDLKKETRDLKAELLKLQEAHNLLASSLKTSIEARLALLRQFEYLIKKTPSRGPDGRFARRGPVC